MSTVLAVGGGFFTRTSRNIELKGGTLYALCQASGGAWLSTTLDLNHHLENIDGTVRVTTQPPGNFLASCENVTLITGPLTALQGRARRKDSSLVTFRLELDDYVTNVEGQLRIGGGFFSRTATQISFTSTGRLEALCLTSAQEWVSAWIDLDFYLENIDGVLRFADAPPGNFMPTSRNVTLIMSTASRWKLRGSAQRYDSGWENFELNLDYNVKNVEGRLIWLLNPHEPYDSIENGRGGFGSYDASSDPQLREYAQSILPHRPPRDTQITPPGSQAERIDIARIIARWDLDIMDRGWRQGTLVEFPREIPGWRIDNQENGAFELNGLQYYSIAVQRGSNVYSSVLVPVGYNLGRTRIRNAMLRSRDEGRVVRISPPPPNDPRQPPPQNDPRIAQMWVQSLSWIVLAGLVLISL